MSDFKPTAPGWYWADTKQMHRVSNIINIKTGKLFLAVEIWDEFGDPDYLPLEEFKFLAPVVPLEDGPGINAVQRDCLATALPSCNLGYMVIGGVDEYTEVLAEYWRGLTNDQREKEFSAEERGLIQTQIQLGHKWSEFKKRTRAGLRPPLPDPSPEAVEKIAREVMDVSWYNNGALAKCGWLASQGFAWLKGKLLARQAAGTLAATEKREGES